MVASLCKSPCLTCWISDRFWRKRDGNEAGLVHVMMVLDAVSETCREQMLPKARRKSCKPLFSAPQQSQSRIAFMLPVELCNRFPQSVQKTRDPIADMLFVAGMIWSEFV